MSATLPARSADSAPPLAESPILAQYRHLQKTASERLAQKRDSQKIKIQIGAATCEYAAGSLEVLDEFKKHIAASAREDIVIHQTGCTGRCSREPIVGVLVPGCLPVKYEKVTRALVHQIFTSHIQNQQPVFSAILDHTADKLYAYEVILCQSHNCGEARDQTTGELLKDLWLKRLAANGLTSEQIKVTYVSCFGDCKNFIAGSCSESGCKKSKAHLLIRPTHTKYQISSLADIDLLITQHLQQGQVVEELLLKDTTPGTSFIDLYGDVPFFSKQNHLAMRNHGIIDPESIEEYLQYRGFAALATVLARQDPDYVLNELTTAMLRGRGGGGFPTATKWAAARAQAEPVKYIICNADEGDPGAFMDRSMLESDPFNIIEGMIIGGLTIGAEQGFFYIRAEYPLAIKRIERALQICREWGLLGKNILGSNFSFDLDIRLGAGAFVCGEETALIHSIEGERGQPRFRPPYPAVRGLFGKPTVINNVETFANIPVIINFGGAWYKRIGSEKSGGTKVFALAGKVRHTGLAEVPMGTTIKEVIYDIGGGAEPGRQIKAIQTGGPAGGCIPEAYFQTPIDFDTLSKLGSIMGSGGMIVLDDTDCMVDIAKFFLSFSQSESCGKCTPCREGTTRMLEILERITDGTGTAEDLVKLERLAALLSKASLCGLGRAAPNPVLSTLKYFKTEYLAHVEERRCLAKKCKALISYHILADKCIGCGVCARHCPVFCISGERREPYVIDQHKCIKCGQCFTVCKFAAIEKSS